MSYLTRSNVAYDLNISPHFEEIEYNDFTIKYVFSSNLYRIKFLSKLGENRGMINRSLSNRFSFNIKADLIGDLKLYTTIEKRGFLIFKDGVKIECRENITLDGLRMITNK